MKETYYKIIIAVLIVIILFMGYYFEIPNACAHAGWEYSCSIHGILNGHYDYIYGTG